jgi:hypothetical protein
MRYSRGVAQPGSVLRSGRRGREFKSRHPDKHKTPFSDSWKGFFCACSPKTCFQAACTKKSQRPTQEVCRGFMLMTLPGKIASAVAGEISPLKIQ